MGEFNVPSAARFKPSLTLLIWVVAWALIGLGGWHISTQIADGNARELEVAQRDLTNLTRLSQEHTTRTLRSADQVARFVAQRYSELGAKLDLETLTREGVIDTDIFPQVGVIDANGLYSLSNLPLQRPVDLSDREHFRVHREATSNQLYISKPVLGRASGKWSIQFTRRLSGRDGQFLGVVVVSLAADYFAKFYQDINLGPNGVVALYGLDGQPRVRTPGLQTDLAPNLDDAALLAKVSAGSERGFFVHRSALDGIPRLFHYRAIKGYPLVSMVGLDRDAMLARADQAGRALWMQGGLLALAILALAAALTHHLRQLRRALALQQQNQKLSDAHNAQLSAVFELSPDGFVTFDRQRCVKSVNPAFRAMTNAQDVPLQGLHEHDFSAWLAQRCNGAPAWINLAALRERVRMPAAEICDQVELTYPTRRILQICLRTGLSDDVSQILYVRDITQSFELDHIKSEFLATAAHELRTPMASVYGYCELLLTQSLPPSEQREFLETIFSQAQLMTDILNELLDLARIEARRGKDFHFVPMDAVALVQNAVQAFSVPKGRACAEVSVPDTRLMVLVDASKLRQAVGNVLSNAYKYSPNGGVVSVSVSADDRNANQPRVCIEIADQGIGLSAKDAARVCERFFRADRSGHIPGSGLGMSIVQEIVQLHQGHLNLETALGQGTRVRIELPRYIAPKESDSPAQEPMATQPSALN
ncbi:MAG: hypothetical protein Fur007_22130 [Rhodoferax sp.]